MDGETGDFICCLTSQGWDLFFLGWICVMSMEYVLEQLLSVDIHIFHNQLRWKRNRLIFLVWDMSFHINWCWCRISEASAVSQREKKCIFKKVSKQEGHKFLFPEGGQKTMEVSRMRRAKTMCFFWGENFYQIWFLGVFTPGKMPCCIF